MEQLTHCLVCQTPSRSARVVHRRRDDALVRCRGCGLVFANPQYTDDELAGLYRDLYYDEEKNFATDYRERDRQALMPLYRAVVRDLSRRYPRLSVAASEVRVLDFGSGVGFFLDACREVGMVPLGVEFSEVAARYANDRLGIEVRTEPERTMAGLPDGRFQLVTAWQVMEHLRRPREFLKELIRVLAPGGILALAVPNLGSWRYRIERGRWFNVQNLTHLSFFNVSNLRRLLDEAGLTRVVRPVLWGRRSRPSVPVDLAQYLIRAANLGNEFRLYGEKPAA
jgi:2-polyprenyl-3-methyl-5-hydroxy-6-metoxy-1,4-benzoquinol methylase